jgi:hypothetical protein
LEKDVTSQIEIEQEKEVKVLIKKPKKKISKCIPKKANLLNVMKFFQKYTIKLILFEKKKNYIMLFNLI